MKQLRDDARYFRESETVESGARDREALFHERRLAMDARAVWPLLLKLRHLDVDTDDREACFVALESYLVRRLIAGYQARSYDRVALELIEALSEQAQIPEAPSKAIRTHLLSYSENANLWPNDAVTIQAVSFGETLDEFMRTVRRVMLEAAVEIGLLDPEKAKATWTCPHGSQLVAGDLTWMHTQTRFHRDDPPVEDKKTGELRRSRTDLNGDYFNTRNNTPSTVPGRGLLMLSVRGEDANQRILLDAGFMRNKDDPERITESELATSMLRRLIKENAGVDSSTGVDLTAGIKGFVYDMALSSASIDEILKLRRVPVVKVPRLAKGRFRNTTLGPHEFKTRSGDEVDPIIVNTLHGQPWSWLPDDKKLQAMPLVRNKLLWGKKGKKRSILYMTVSIPDREDVPEPLRGATTMIRINSTPAEVANDPHTRRTKSLRPIPEQDPHFAEIFGAREDIESTFSCPGSRILLTSGRVRFECSVI